MLQDNSLSFFIKKLQQSHLYRQFLRHHPDYSDFLKQSNNMVNMCPSSFSRRNFNERDNWVRTVLILICKCSATSLYFFPSAYTIIKIRRRSGGSWFIAKYKTSISVYSSSCMISATGIPSIIFSWRVFLRLQSLSSFKAAFLTT